MVSFFLIEYVTFLYGLLILDNKNLEKPENSLELVTASRFCLLPVFFFSIKF